MKRAISNIFSIALDGNTPLRTEKGDYKISKTGNYVVVTLHERWVERGFKALRVDEELFKGDLLIRLELESVEPMKLKAIAFRF
jgi:hypothetical protein